MLYRIKTTIIGKKLWSCFCIISLSLFLCSFIIGTFLYGSAKENKKNALQQIGAKISICADPTYLNNIQKNEPGNEIDLNEIYTPFDNKTLDQILEIKHVEGIEAMSGLSIADALPLNFANSKLHSGEDPEQQPLKVDKNTIISEEVREIYSRSVNIVGCSCVNLYDFFRREISTLQEGYFPTDNDPGIIISKELAEENGLHAGDWVMIEPYETIYEESEETVAWKIQKRNTVEVKITGIYSTKLYFNVTENNEDADMIYRISPYNTVFSDYKTGAEIAGNEASIRFFDVYVDDPGNMDAVIREIERLDIDWDKYMIMNDLEEFYKQYAGQIEKLLKTTKGMTVFSISAGSILYFVIMLLLNKKRTKDIFVYRSIGESYKHYNKYIILESLVFSISAFIFSMIISCLVLCIIRMPVSPRLISNDIAYTVSYFEIGENDFIPTLNIRINAGSIIKSTLYLLFLQSITLFLAIIRSKKVFLMTSHIPEIEDND